MVPKDAKWFILNLKYSKKTDIIKCFSCILKTHFLAATLKQKILMSLLHTVKHYWYALKSYHVRFFTTSELFPFFFIFIFLCHHLIM